MNRIRIALIELKMEELISQKKWIEKRLYELYELKEVYEEAEMLDDRCYEDLCNHCNGGEE